jgi:Tfp pilus assembly protein PilZ
MTVQNLAGHAAPNRRRYPRIPALIHCRPAGADFFAQHLEPVDIGLGGVRIHSQEEYRVGELLRLDVFFPQVAPVLVTTEIMWIEPLGSGSPRRFDVGLAFVDLNSGALRLLLRVLESGLDEPASGVTRVVPESTMVRKVRDSRPMLARTPIVLVSKENLRAVPLDGRSGFLVSLIDGLTSVETLIDLSGMPADETLGLLEELRLRRIVELC